MPRPRATVSYSLSTYHYYPPGIPNPSSPSGPPPSHSDSPSPRRSGAGTRNGLRAGTGSSQALLGMPKHWRKVTYTIVAEDLDSNEGAGGQLVSMDVKREAIRKWLRLALAPYLELKPETVDGLPARQLNDFEKVLDDAVEKVVKDRKMVDRIWSLKKLQGG